MDVNRDGVVTLDEFLECCRNDDAISRSMAVFDTSFWPDLDNAAAHAAVNATNATAANEASGTTIIDCSNQRHVTVGGLSNHPPQHYHPDRHQPHALRHHQHHQQPLASAHEHQLPSVCNCSNSNNHQQHDNHHEPNHLNQNNQQNSSLVVSSHQQQIPPDSPSLVKVKSWYTVAKQGVSC